MGTRVPITRVVRFNTHYTFFLYPGICTSLLKSELEFKKMFYLLIALRNFRFFLSNKYT